MGSSGADYATASSVKSLLGQLSTRIDFPPRLLITGNTATTAGRAYFVYFWAPFSLTVTQLTSRCANTGAVGTTLARMGIYTVAANEDVTLVARTASDTALWTAADTTYTRSLDTTGGYPASYAMVEGRRYAWGFIAVGSSTPPGLGSSVSSLKLSLLGPVFVRALSAQTDLPTTATYASMVQDGSAIYMGASV